MAQKMDGVVEILQHANELPTNENGEVELDLSAVSPSTCWSLFEFVFGPIAAAAGAPVGPARSSGFKIEEDSDYEPEDDDED